ncbi:MAG: pyridoxamine 5'-phosphate oxidase family protein [Candidatus Nitrosotenuis sp.]
MSVIPDKVKQLIAKEKVLIVGTSYRGISNVSPRTAFHIDSNGAIYWLEIFRHKTFRNISKNSWSSVSVFDKQKLVGFQLKGRASFVVDRKTKSQIMMNIVDRLNRLHRQKILRNAKSRRPNIVKFSANLIFSLNPNELSDSPIVVNSNNKLLKATHIQW